MKNIALLVIAALCLCTHNLYAKPPAGSRGSLSLLFDRGLEGKDAVKQQQLNQVGEYFEADMVKRFEKSGFAVTKITARDQFKPGPDKYLLMVATVQYTPGNKAARMLVGYGAGGMISQIVELQLFGEASEPILATKKDRGSVRDWQFVCSKLSEDVVKLTNETLAAKK